jgi:hypothetical protein
VLVLLKVDDLAFDILLSRSAQMEALQLCQVWPEETTGEALLSAERLTIILVMLGGISGAVCLLVDIADGRLSIEPLDSPYVHLPFALRRREGGIVPRSIV